MEERGANYSGKHHLYGCKTEFFVLFNGLSIGHTYSRSASKTDIDICRSNSNWRSNVLKKNNNILYADQRKLPSNYSASWAARMYMRYTDMADTLKCMIPK